MQVLKFGAPLLFTGQKFLENTVLITDREGKVIELVHINDAGEDVQYENGMLCPGFVNCHCHLELSHMHGLIPEKTGLVDFVFNVVTQRHFKPNEIEEAIVKADEQMHMNGIVAVGDICNTTHTLPAKLTSKTRYYNFIEASGWLPGVSKQRFERSLATFNMFTQVPAQSAIVPHAPYSVSKELWKEIMPYFQRKVVTIHNHETAFEDEFFMKGSGDFTRMYQLMNIDNSHFTPAGTTSLRHYFSNLSAAANCILVHNTFTLTNDIAFANATAKQNSQNLFWCVCINANQYIENALPPLDRLIEQGSTIVIGTDSLASNHSLDILGEIRTIKKHFANIQLKHLLQWATLNGAKALQMEDHLGSFDTGKKPGVLLIENNLEGVRRLL